MSTTKINHGRAGSIYQTHTKGFPYEGTRYEEKGDNDMEGVSGSLALPSNYTEDALYNAIMTKLALPPEDETLGMMLDRIDPLGVTPPRQVVQGVGTGGPLLGCWNWEVTCRRNEIPRHPTAGFFLWQDQPQNFEYDDCGMQMHTPWREWLARQGHGLETCLIAAAFNPAQVSGLVAEFMNWRNALPLLGQQRELEAQLDVGINNNAGTDCLVWNQLALWQEPGGVGFALSRHWKKVTAHPLFDKHHALPSHASQRVRVQLRRAQNTASVASSKKRAGYLNDAKYVCRKRADDTRVFVKDCPICGATHRSLAAAKKCQTTRNVILKSPTFGSL